MSIITPPSRRDNPFATCWTRPGRIDYRFPVGESAEGLVEKLAAQNWRAAITGLHGSGKSTLLESLRPALIAAGKEVQLISLRDRQRRLPADFVLSDNSASNLVLIVDGYEQLSLLERWRLGRVCGRKGCGLLVTAHSPTRYPTLIHTTPNLAIIEQLAASLCIEVSTSVRPKDVAASHAIHGSNVREIFFDLYDRHELRRRTARTGAQSIV